MTQYEIEIVIDDICFSDYYSGHGHAFEKENLKACIQFCVSVDYTETVREIVEGIIGELNDEPYFLTENEKEQDEILELLTDSLIERELRENVISENVKDSDNFFTGNQRQDFLEGQKDIDDSDMLEYPYLYGYLHVYREID